MVSVCIKLLQNIKYFGLHYYTFPHLDYQKVLETIMEHQKQRKLFTMSNFPTGLEPTAT